MPLVLALEPDPKQAATLRQIVQALPPMRRTRERGEVEAFLAALEA